MLGTILCLQALAFACGVGVFLQPSAAHVAGVASEMSLILRTLAALGFCCTAIAAWLFVRQGRVFRLVEVAVAAVALFLALTTSHAQPYALAWAVVGISALALTLTAIAGIVDRTESRALEGQR